MRMQDRKKMEILKKRFITDANLNRLQNFKRKVYGRALFRKHFMLFSSTLPEKQIHHCYYTQHYSEINKRAISEKPSELLFTSMIP